MSASALATIVARYSKLCQPFPQESDAELVLRFVQRNDAAAFEQLVGRYASLVWGVCRRVLPCEADCEDAFQATFLSLVRQAGVLDPHRPLAAWLHTVALRVARKAWGRAQRQAAQLTHCLDGRSSPPVQSDGCTGELMSSIDAELERLPAPLRVPIILCCLEGRTRDEAAEAMGCTVAAVKSRLERGRSLLRKRLQHRGFQLPAAFLVLTLTGSRVSATLQAMAVKSALGAPPATVAVLAATSGVSFFAKAMTVALSLITVGLLGIGAMAAIQSPTQEDKAPPENAQADSKTLASSAKKETAQPLRDRFGDPLPDGAVRRFGTLRFRHNEIVDLAFTPDGKRLIAGCGRAPLVVFDAKTGEKLAQIGKVTPNNYYGFALSPDGKRVACCGFDLTLWDLESGNLIKELKCGRCGAVAFSPDGTKIVAAKEFTGQFQVVDVATRTQVRTWKLGEEDKEMYFVNALSYSPDGKHVAGIVSGFQRDDGDSFREPSTQMHLWNPETGAPAGTLGTPKDKHTAFAFQPGGNRAATIGQDQAVQFWDLETLKKVQEITPTKKGASATSLRFSADGKRCGFYDGKGSLVVVDVGKSKELRRFDLGQPDSHSPCAIALDTEGRTLAFARFGDSSIRVWDVGTGEERLGDAGHRPAATLELSADGRALISRGDKVFRWDLQTGEGRVQSGEAAEDSRKGKWDKGAWHYQGMRWQFVSGGLNNELEILSLDGKKSIRKIKEPAATRGHAISPDGVHLAISYQDRPSTVFLWNPEKNEEPHKLIGHPDACQQLLFSHDGGLLIAGAGTHNKYPSETLFVYDVATGKLIHKFATNSAPGPMILTADDRLLITGGLWNDAAVHVWDMQSGNQLATLADPSLTATSEPQNVPTLQLAISNLALSVDERLLTMVTNSGDTSMVSVWETNSWKLVRAFVPNRPRHANSVVISQDGRSVFVANSDSTILEWDVTGRHGKKAEPLLEGRLDKLWQALAESPDKAYPALWEMESHPAEAVRFLKTKLTAALAANEKEVRKLLAQLDADSFQDREQASRMLSELGEPALAILRKALKEDLSNEAKTRIEKIVQTLSTDLTPDQHRMLRALAVLEWSRLTEADELLHKLADGEASARLTKAAKEAENRRRGKIESEKPKP
jgi:RNA polymerase sigma factor (sigma-70 family)